VIPAALIAAARESIRKQRAEDAATYDTIEAKLTELEGHVAAGRIAETKALAQELCDLEYGLMNECEACGPLAEVFEPQ
jgi:hypothetical protein